MIFTLIAYQPNVRDSSHDVYRDSDLIVESFTDREVLLKRWVGLTGKAAAKFDLADNYGECTLLINGYQGTEDADPHYELRCELSQEAQDRASTERASNQKIIDDAAERKRRAQDAEYRSPEYQEYRRLASKFGRW